MGQIDNVVISQLKFLTFIILISTGCRPIYYGINGYGKMCLNPNGLFYFDYYDSGADTGYYRKNGDTVFLTSRRQSLKMTNTDALISPKGYQISLFISDSKGCNIQELLAIFDTLREEVYVSGDFKENQYLSIQLFFKYNLLINDDIEGPFWLKPDLEEKRILYFDNYPLINEGKFLLPFNRYENNYFKIINGCEFLPMKKGKKKKIFNTYSTGIGVIN